MSIITACHLLEGESAVKYYGFFLTIYYMSFSYCLSWGNKPKEPVPLSLLSDSLLILNNAVFPTIYLLLLSFFLMFNMEIFLLGQI